MPDQDIFDEDEGKNKETPAEQTPPDGEEKPGESTPEADQLLSLITNEDGTPKYKTLEEMAKGAAHAQEHIRNIESELAEAKAKGNPTEKLEELLEAVKSKGSGQGEEASTMKPEDVLGIVKDFFSDVKAAESRENNISTVTTVFKERYGKDAREKLYGKAEDLGFSKEEINRMIATNPTAALKVLGEDAPKRKQADPVGGMGVSTSQFRETPPSQPKSVMGHTSQKVLMDAWEQSKQKTLERLGYNK
jgi:hypothetical protein